MSSLSQKSTFESLVSNAVPAAVGMLDGDYGYHGTYATAIYAQFTSGTAPPWFTALPAEVQSYLVLEFLPHWLGEPMTIDMLALASPAARPASVPATTTVASSALTPTQTSIPTQTQTVVSNKGETPGKNRAIIAGTVIPIASLILLTSLALWLLKRRKAKTQRNSSAMAIHPFDPERATQRWSETTFSTAAPVTKQQQPSNISQPRFAAGYHYKPGQ